MSHEKFEVGEIAIAVSPNAHDELGVHGTEVLIEGPLQQRTFTDGLVYWSYLTSSPAKPGWQLRAKPEWLRKRPPKQDWKSICNLTDTPREVEHV
jgi:hypothetical protein